MPVRGWPLLAVAAVLCALSAVVAYVVLVSRSPTQYGAIALSFAPDFLVVTVLAVVVLALTVWKRRWLAAALALLSVLLSGSVSLVPTFGGLTTANQSGIGVSVTPLISNAFTVNAGEPVTAKSVRFAVIGGHQLNIDVWRPLDSNKRAIVLIHGGGWISGDRSRTPRWDRLFSSVGYTVFDVQYRLHGELPPGSDLAPIVGDTKCALAWITANAGSYGVDRGRITLMGQSAGAHLALMTAYTTAADGLPPSCQLPEGKPRAVVDLYGPTDLAASTDWTAVMAGTPAQRPAEYRKLSPLTYAKPGRPPTLIVAGLSDRIVPVSQSKLLDGALTKAGVRHQALYLPYADHGFDINWGSFQTQTAVAVVARFLDTYG
ncbi:alpha/beta hydrolase [Fodinicola acaciae]|uniref:alpha/beta hydrolase n=1 Tax=Fodinicola acaciae TaxID=2681555 RepID=UPI0013D03312|nr:alpha/beta hydrolase [Fodinicola acaciae]